MGVSAMAVIVVEMRWWMGVLIMKGFSVFVLVVGHCMQTVTDMLMKWASVEG